MVARADRVPSEPHTSPGTATACNREMLSPSGSRSLADEDDNEVMAVVVGVPVVVVHGAIISPGTATASNLAMLSSMIIGWTREWLM